MYDYLKRVFFFAVVTFFLLYLAINRAHAHSIDSAVAPASLKYKKSTAFKIYFGNNYRIDWTIPVKMPVLDINKERGGLTITKLKGGFETISLFMVTKDSTQLVLRTIDKDLKKLVPGFYKNTPMQTVIQDIISNAEPYAPFTVPVMADALGIICAHPKLFYINDNPDFGKYRELYAGKVCLLEERWPVRPGTKHESMESPLLEVPKDNKNIVLQKEVLKARLLDMILGDWDRHPGQWYWGSFDSIGNRYFYPVPVDRDMTYFHSTGLFVKVTRLVAVKFLRGFTYKMNKLYKLNLKAKNFDQLFMNELSKNDWASAIHEVQAKLNDSVVEQAVNRFPPEILAIRGNEIKQKIRSRRDGLYTAAMKYYSRLARRVYIPTSAKPDRIIAANTHNGTTISIYHDTEQNQRNIVYRRTFDKHDTRKVYVVGIAENDKIDLSTPGAIEIKPVRDQDRNSKKYDIRQKTIKMLDLSLNNLGQPGFKEK